MGRGKTTALGMSVCDSLEYPLEVQEGLASMIDFLSRLLACRVFMSSLLSTILVQQSPPVGQCCSTSQCRAQHSYAIT